MKKSLGFILGCIATKNFGVSSDLEGKIIYYKITSDYTKEYTTSIFDATRFESVEEIENLKIEENIMGNGDIYRGSFLYEAFGQSEEDNSLFIQELLLSDTIKIIKESNITKKGTK